MSTSGWFSRFSHTQGRFPSTKKHFGSVPAAFGGLSWWRLLATNLAGFGRYASPQTFRNIENEQNPNHGNLFSPRTHLDPKVYQFSAPNSIANVFDREWHHLQGKLQKVALRYIAAIVAAGHDQFTIKVGITRLYPISSA